MRHRQAPSANNVARQHLSQKFIQKIHHWTASGNDVLRRAGRPLTGGAGRGRAGRGVEVDGSNKHLAPAVHFPYEVRAKP